MSKYELTPAEQVTMESLQEKGAFGLRYEVCEFDEDVGMWRDLIASSGDPAYVSLEAAHALMCRRVKQKLGPLLGSIIWKMDGTVRVFLDGVADNERSLYDGVDELAALIAALEDKR